MEIVHFDLTVLPCRAGFVLKQQSNGLVQCDCLYTDTLWFGREIISCHKETEEIILVVSYDYCIQKPLIDDMCISFLGWLLEYCSEA